MIGAAVMIGKIATGECKDTAKRQPNKANSGLVGAAARTIGPTSEQRKEIAKKAVSARWE